MNKKITQGEINEICRGQGITRKITVKDVVTHKQEQKKINARNRALGRM